MLAAEMALRASALLARPSRGVLSAGVRAASTSSSSSSTTTTPPPSTSSWFDSLLPRFLQARGPAAAEADAEAGASSGGARKARGALWEEGKVSLDLGRLPRDIKRINHDLIPESELVRDASTLVLSCFADWRKQEARDGGAMQARGRRGRREKAEAAAASGSGGGDGGEAGGEAGEEAGAGTEGNGLSVLDIKAASGVRALRYALEVPGVERVDANEMDPNAVAALRRNIARNGAEATVAPLQTDARVLMLQRANEYDAIELDPYGEPVAFLDGAVQAVRDGGLLCVTSIGLNNLCAQVPEVCWAKYGSQPLTVEGEYSSEMAIRILLYSIQSHALRHRRHITPVLSFSTGSTIRTFVRVHASATQSIAKDGATKVSYVYQCRDCHSFSFQPVGVKRRYKQHVRHRPSPAPAVDGRKCEHCGGDYVMGGPIWTDPIHNSKMVTDISQRLNKGRNRDYYRGLLPSYDRLVDLVALVKQELKHVPLSVSLSVLVRTLKCSPPPSNDIRFALANAGFQVSSTHERPNNVKTDAPFRVIWDIMRCYVRDHPATYPPEEGTPGHNILAQAPTLEARFSRVHKVMKKKRKGAAASAQAKSQAQAAARKKV